MTTLTLDKLEDAVLLSKFYRGGKIKLNITKTASKLGVSRKKLSRRLNGFVPKKTRSRKKYFHL